MWEGELARLSTGFQTRVVMEPEAAQGRAVRKEQAKDKADEPGATPPHPCCGTLKVQSERLLVRGAGIKSACMFSRITNSVVIVSRDLLKCSETLLIIYVPQ